MYFYNISDRTLKEIHEDNTLVSIEPSYTRAYFKNKPEANELSQYFIYSRRENETQAGENFRKFAKTDYFLYKFLKSHKYDYDFVADTIKTPLINDFTTGEIKDKPDVFLNFDEPETLDDQLAKIYGLTTEQKEAIKLIVEPWKNDLLTKV